MFRFTSRNLIYLGLPNRNHNNVFRIQEPITNSLRLHQTLALESHSSNTCNPKSQHLTTVSYLTNKCGLSLHSATLASKQVTITSTHRADSVLQLFQSYGFTQPQITRLIAKCPSLIQSDSATTLEPNFQYLESLGLSKPDLAKIFSSDNCPPFILSNPDRMEPNVSALRTRGVPDANISKLLMLRPRAFVMRNDVFRDALRRVEEMGLCPKSLAFLRAIEVMVTASKTLWERKVNVFKSFGWSENDIIVAFKVQPRFIACSEKKIRIMMNFYLNRLSLKASDVAKYPNLLTLSLEKRLIPRCSVLNLLLSKGLISDLNIVTALNMMKGDFEKRFVTKYLETVPEIRDQVSRKTNRNHNNVFRIQESITNSLPLLQTLAKVESNNSNNLKNQDNPTLSYLINKCGLPLHSAISASKKITLTATTHKPDSVLHLFKSYGFTQTQITDIITKCPSVLVANPDKTLEPKFEYFESLGISKPDLPNMLFRTNRLSGSSLTKTIVPNVDFLKSILHTNENLLNILKAWPYVIYHNLRNVMEPNVLTLRAHGIPESNISKLLIMTPQAFTIRNDLLRDRVRRVTEMGICPKSNCYIRSIVIMLTLSESLWEKKLNIFKSFGWSDGDILAAFMKQPFFMGCSEKKIWKMMGFYLNKLGLKSSDVVKYPNILLLSLEKRIIPRCSVLQLLLSKGLIGNDCSLVSTLNTNKADFDKRFVTQYQEVIPEIASVYNGEKGVPTFEASQFAAVVGVKNLQKVDIYCD